MSISQKKIADFQNGVWAYYREHRRKLPWRPPSLKLRKDKALNPWKILVSEVMLQQTQAARVAPFYKKFVKRFPTPRALARARSADVLQLWSGLGYNRRALHLKRAAEVIVSEYDGEVPRDAQKLDALPGIGANTAAAILAYAWNEPVVFVETNIRTVFLHHFFPKRKKVKDGEIVEWVKKALPISPLVEGEYSEFTRREGVGAFRNTTTPSRLKSGHPSSTEEGIIREWYSALMDYGAHLKQTQGNPNARSARYKKQAKFAGSVRQMRGEIVRRALAGTLRARDFPTSLLVGLVREGFLQKRARSFILRS